VLLSVHLQVFQRETNIYKKVLKLHLSAQEHLSEPQNDYLTIILLEHYYSLGLQFIPSFNLEGSTCTWNEWLDRQEDSRVVSWFPQTKFSHQLWWFLSHLACSNKQRDNVKNTITNGGMIDSRVTDIGDDWQWVNK